MKKELEYHRSGDYLLPNLTPPESSPLGVWGLCRRDYLLKHKKGIYTALQLSGKLDAHLAEINWEAAAMCARLITEMAQREGITEELKAADQMEWVRRMNSIRARAEAIVRANLIYT